MLLNKVLIDNNANNYNIKHRTKEDENVFYCLVHICTVLKENYLDFNMVCKKRCIYTRVASKSKTKSLFCTRIFTIIRKNSRQPIKLPATFLHGTKERSPF
ncbi:hypothetical protein COK55_27145 [Bacillus cereus]|nr:hypothetical protein COK55_27145 [Bacillus cereus]